jgi:hypothetical protein
MKKTTFLLLGLLTVLLLTSFDDKDFPILSKIKSITEWKEWADTNKYNSPQWIKSKREYYSNGELSGILHLGLKGDTTTLLTYILNKDSTLKKEKWYNIFLHKWIAGDSYYYNKGEKYPYMSKDKAKHKCYYTYNNQRKIIAKRFSGDKGENFAEYEYTFDSSGLMVQQIEFDCLGGQRDERRIYVYEYEKNSKWQVIKKETFLVPHTAKESITKTDKFGNQKTSYYGFSAKEKTLTETVLYNTKGERTKKIEYDRDGKPQFISTYDYQYYQ